MTDPKTLQEYIDATLEVAAEEGCSKFSIGYAPVPGDPIAQAIVDLREPGAAEILGDFEAAVAADMKKRREDKD